MKSGVVLLLSVLICSWFTYGLARELATANVHSSDVKPAWSSSWSWGSSSPGQGSWSWSTSPGGSWSWSRSTPGGSWSSWSTPWGSWSSSPRQGSTGSPSPPVPVPIKDSEKCGCYIQKVNSCVYEVFNSANANTKISPDCCSVVEGVQDDCVGIAVINPYYVPTIKAHCTSKAAPPTATKTVIKA